MSPRKKVKPLSISLDYDEYSIVAHYETQYVEEDGMIVERDQSFKKVRLPRDFTREEI